MARYIDADAIVDEMDRYIEHFTRLGIVVDGNECFYKVNELLADAPAADVVEVVRCKDCKHHKERGWYNICDIHVGNGYPDNWFCADGERRE